jgi:hypothetical protein
MSKVLENQKRIFSNLIGWLKKNNAVFPNIFIDHVSDRYRGVKASKYIKPNSSIISIPFKCIMNVKKAKESEIGKMITDKKLPIDCDHDLLSLFLLSEKIKGNKSFFKPYIDSIPSTYNDFPHFYTKKYKDSIMKGSMLVDMIYSRNLEIQDTYNNLKKLLPDFFKKITIGKFIWARIAVVSRIFGNKNNEYSGLVPLSDMLNHDTNPGTHWEFLENEKKFVINSTRHICKGMDILDTYGEKCNSRYLINYGFTLPDNKDNNTCVLFINPKELIPNLNPGLYNEKLQFFNKLSTKNFDDGFSGYSYLVGRKKEKKIRVNNEFRFQVGIISEFNLEEMMNNELKYDVNTITHLMFGLLRLIFMQRKEWDMYMSILNSRHKLNFYNVLRFIKPLDIDTEIQILDTISSLCEKKLRLFSNNIDTNKQLYSECKVFSPESNTYMMLISEQEILIYFIRYCLNISSYWHRSDFNINNFTKLIKKNKLTKSYYQNVISHIEK